MTTQLETLTTMAHALALHCAAGTTPSIPAIADAVQRCALAVCKVSRANRAKAVLDIAKLTDPELAVSLVDREAAIEAARDQIVCWFKPNEPIDMRENYRMVEEQIRQALGADQ